jgi:hypothetical protein
MRVGDIVKVFDPHSPKGRRFNYGMVVRSVAMHYDDRYRMWDVLIEGSVKNVAESWMVALDSK